MTITNASIDTSVRRVVLSSAILQEQIVSCCCTPSSSSSSASLVAGRRQQTPTAAAILNVAQRSTRVAGTEGAVQFATTVINSGAQAAQNVVLTVELSPALAADAFQLKAEAGWQTASLTKMVSAAVTLQPGKAQTFSFEIAPVQKAPAVTVTTIASATAAGPGAAHTATPLQSSIGG